MNHSMSESSSYYLYVTSFLKDNIPIGVKLLWAVMNILSLSERYNFLYLNNKIQEITL